MIVSPVRCTSSGKHEPTLHCAACVARSLEWALRPSKLALPLTRHLIEVGEEEANCKLVCDVLALVTAAKV